MAFPRLIQAGALFALALASSAAGAAPAFPATPIRFVVGPSSDVLPRVIAEKLQAMWGQPVIVDQRPGGGGAIAAETVSKAAPNGYTWLTSTATYTVNAALVAKPNYSLMKDFAPVARLSTAPFYLLVHPSLPVKSVAELIQYARAHPGELKYASAGVGTPPHLAGEMLKSMANIDIVHVPYKSPAASLNDLLGGHVQFSFQYAPSALPYIKTGQLRALAVTGSTRALAAPDLPTVAEAGKLPGFEVLGWVGVHVPAKTPKDVIRKINAGLVSLLQNPDVKASILSQGAEPAGDTPEEFAAFVKADVERWTAVVRKAGIQPE